MDFNFKNILFISALQFSCGCSFAQEAPEPAPAPPKAKEVSEYKQEEIYDVVDEPAEFPGGKEALLKYLKDNLKYPETAEETGLQGKCYLKFIVSAKGEISNVKVLKGVADCPECDKEAIRLVKGMPKWKPGKINGKAVNSTFSMPVVFRLQ